ncbi:MAG: efflux RND transporter periplasmic adaptor subunit [Myxococcota bacterium]
MVRLLLICFLFACGGDDSSSNENTEDNANDERRGRDGKGRYGGWAKKDVPPKPLLVEYAVVGIGAVTDQLETTGTLESIEQANIIPETNGTIQKIFVREGDAVQKGQELATLINPSLDAGAERAKLELDRAQREADKAISLHTQGAISDLEKQEAELGLKTAQTAYTEATRSKGFTRIRSPITGVVAFVDIREGELGGGTRAFQVVNPRQLRIVANVPEQDLSALSEQQKVVISATYDEEVQVDGYIERIAPVVDPGSGTVKVFINLEADQTLLRPGQFVRAQIETDVHTDVIAIPKGAIVYKDGEAVAFVIEEAPPEANDEDADTLKDRKKSSKEDGESEEENLDTTVAEGPQYIASLRRLELGYIDSKFAEVHSGLETGELIVTIGNAAIRDQSAVRYKIESDETSETTAPSEIQSVEQPAEVNP